MSDVQLELAAEILGPLVDEVVFVGGATIHLWLNEEGVPPTRATDDVDVISDVQTRGEYYALADRLRERDLEEAINEPVICRWRHKDTGLAIDVMPVAGEILGFSNPWYRLGIETAIEHRLDSGTKIRAVRPPLVVATKLAAWKGRGKNDLLRSEDIHDILVLVNGRPELADELVEQPVDLQQYVTAELEALRNDPYFDYAVSDAVRGYGSVAKGRADIVRERAEDIITRLSN